MVVVDYKYEPATTLMGHQKKVLNLSWHKPYFAWFLEMGTGKSKILIDNIAALYETSRITAAVIVAPKGVYNNWVERELPKHMPDRINWRAACWRSSPLASDRASLEELAQADLPILVVNIEALSRKPKVCRAFQYVRDFVLRHRCMLAVDESTVIKNHRAISTKNMIALAQHAPYRRVLSGYPVVNKPLDLWGQCEFLKHGLLGSNFTAFRSQYAIIKKIDVGTHIAPTIVGFQNLEHLKERIRPFSIRITKQECMDLPPKIYERYEVELTPEQIQAYKSMRKHALVKLAEDKQASAKNTLTQIMRLQQIVCGHIQEDGAEEPRPLSQNRVNALIHVLEGMQGQSIVWCRWQFDVRVVAEALREAQYKVVEHYGPTSAADRRAAIDDFQAGKADIFLGTPSSGGRGLTLTAASNVIYYSNSYDLEHRIQSEDRAHRIGQTKSVTYVDLVAPKTVDEKILYCLENKIDLAEQVIGRPEEWV